MPWKCCGGTFSTYYNLKRHQSSHYRRIRINPSEIGHYESDNYSEQEEEENESIEWINNENDTGKFLLNILNYFLRSKYHLDFISQQHGAVSSFLSNI